MLKVRNQFQYHERGTKIILAVGDAVQVEIGVPATKIKTGEDGFNHRDLALGALCNFLSWPPSNRKILMKGERLKLEAFTAYRIQGEFELEGDFSEAHFFYMP